MANPFAEALGLLDRHELQKAIDLLHWAGRDLDPLAYDEAWAEVELERDRYGEAAGLAERTLAAGRETSRLHEIAGQALWELGTYVEATRHAELAGEATARNAHLLARIAWEDKDYFEAERLAERALALAPGWAEADATRLAARSAQGQTDARVGLRLLWEATRLDWALLLLLEDAIRRQDRSVANDLLREALASGSLDGHLLGQIMWTANEMHDWHGAIAAFDAAPEKVRNTAFNLRARGIASTGQGDYAGALPFLEQAYALQPTDEWTVDALFNALGRTWRWRRAIQVLNEHSRLRKAAGIPESSVGEFRRNLRWRHRGRR